MAAREDAAMSVPSMHRLLSVTALLCMPLTIIRHKERGIANLPTPSPLYSGHEYGLLDPDT